ncbi:hypothetical protein [Sphingomonas sp. Leaf37]|uniref:hypothetical protein n=1 Tax=Sphingomonas sp. Leaf37 TaxID=2876552 RepID=UPI001E322677|nr:hypothetical protein [Sphingomonas sp. Leaf37]
MASYTDHKPAALAVLNHPQAQLNYRIGQFLGGIAFSDRPLTDKQAGWLSKLLDQHGLPPLASEDEA